MAGSSLFHSVIADGNKVFLKKLCLILIRGIQSTFLVAEEVFSGIKQKDKKEFCPYKFCKTLLIFYTIVVIKVVLTLALGNSSLSRSPVLRQLLPNMLYTEWTLVFVERTN